MIFKLLEDFTYPASLGGKLSKYINPENGEPFASAAEFEKYIVNLFNLGSSENNYLKEIVKSKIDKAIKAKNKKFATPAAKRKAEEDLAAAKEERSKIKSGEEMAIDLLIDIQADLDVKKFLELNRGILEKLLMTKGINMFKNADTQLYLQYISELKEFNENVEDKLEFVLNSWKTLKEVVNTHDIFKSRSLYLEAGKDIKDFKYFLNILKVLADDKLKSNYFDLDKELGDGTKASDTINIDNLLDNGSLPEQKKVYEKIEDWTRDFGATPKGEKENNSKDKSETKLSNFNIVNSIYNILGKNAFNSQIELQGGKIDFNGANIGWLFKILEGEHFNIVIPETMYNALKTTKLDDAVKKEFLAISADKLDDLKTKINTFIKDNYTSEEQ